MRAVCWEGTANIRVETVPDPVILNPRDAIVRVTTTAICGSDLHIYDGYIPTMQKGDVLGHEFMGEVVEVGNDTTRLTVGDRVVVPFTIACGHCYFCKEQLWSLCDNSNPNAWMAEKLYGYSASGLFGYSHMYGGYPGGQAEYARAPFADVGPLKVPDALTDDQVLFLSDIFSTGYMAAENCQIKPSDTVAVWGCGPVGQFAIKSAFLLGAERVIAIDRFAERLELASQISRLGGPNFHEIPINAPIAQVHNNQREGLHRQAIHRGRVSYEPNSLGGGCPFQAGAAGFVSFPEPREEDDHKVRGKAERFADHYTQATLFWNSQTDVEKRHIINAFRFELSRVQTPAVRERMVSGLMNVATELAEAVAAGLGIREVPAPMPKVMTREVTPEVSVSRALSLFARPGDGSIRTRRVAVLVADGCDGEALVALAGRLTNEGAVPRFVAMTLGSVQPAAGDAIEVDVSLEAAPAVLYDALVLPDGTEAINTLRADGRTIEFITLQADSRGGRQRSVAHGLRNQDGTAQRSTGSGVDHDDGRERDERGVYRGHREASALRSRNRSTARVRHGAAAYIHHEERRHG